MRSFRFTRSLCTFASAAGLACVVVSAQTSPAPSPPPTAPVADSDDIVQHLERTIAWYREVVAAEQQGDLGDDPVAHSRLRQTAIDALQLAFDYARAAAVLFRQSAAPAPESAAPGPGSNFEQIDNRLEQREAALQTRLNDINASLARAGPAARKSLTAERDQVTANLQLLKTIEGSIDQIVRFAATSQSADRGTDALTAQIDALQRSVPEARPAQARAAQGTRGATGGAAAAPAQPPAAPGVSTAAPGPSFRPESAGIVALATELVRMETARRQLGDVLKQTDALMQSVDARRSPLSGAIRSIVRQTATTAPATGTAGSVDAQRDLQAAILRVRQLSTALVPLGEQGVAVDAARATLLDSRTELTARAATTARYLLIRVLILLIAIGVVLMISEIWRRATFRYLRDVRRRRQFLLVRRIVVAGAIIVVLAIGFVSQIGSLATYAGFVTAGIAVALQNVILAVVAYFFLIGRYGVRAGDRITIGGVTGSVIEVGLVRMYLMELAAPDWRPTGRIVVFSNAVLFQPAALFKQMPGVDYGWHAVILTLAEGADLPRAEREIRGAVESAYADFRQAIERQHAALQESVNVQTPVPAPEVQIRFVDEGIMVTVRYPVERSRATEMDNRIMTAIRDALATAPPIPLAAGGAPKLQEQRAL